MIQHINVSLIRQDGGTQARAAMVQEAIDEYALAMADGKEFPAVTVFFDGEVYWLGDGFHRVAAHIKAFGIAPIRADVQDGSQRDALLFATGANANHGVRRTVADKRKAVSALLDDPEWCQWSDREIARKVDVSHTFVANLRAASRGGNVATLESNNHISKRDDLGPEPSPSNDGCGVKVGGASAPSEISLPGSAPTEEHEQHIAASGDAAKSQVRAQELEAEVASLKEQLASRDAKIADLERKLAEAGEQVQELHEDLNAAKDVLDAEDLRARFEKEVAAVGARARQAETRLRAAQAHVRDAQHMAKIWKGKFEKLEKQQAKAKKAELEEVAS